MVDGSLWPCKIKIRLHNSATKVKSLHISYYLFRNIDLFYYLFKSSHTSEHTPGPDQIWNDCLGLQSLSKYSADFYFTTGHKNTKRFLTDRFSQKQNTRTSFPRFETVSGVCRNRISLQFWWNERDLVSRLLSQLLNSHQCRKTSRLNVTAEANKHEKRGFVDIKKTLFVWFYISKWGSTAPINTSDSIQPSVSLVSGKKTSRFDSCGFVM